MKKVLFLSIALMVIIGCGTQVEKIDPARKAFEEAYKAKMDFPETYEFLKMEKLDSATYQDILNTRKNYLDRMSFAFDQEDYDKLSKVQNNLADTAMNVATCSGKCCAPREPSPNSSSASASIPSGGASF